MRKEPANKDFPRPMIEYISKHTDGELVGVEIGVFSGLNAMSILKTLPIKKLYLVDPYKKYIGKHNKYHDTQLQYEQAKEQLKEYKDKIEFIRLESEIAIDKIPDNLDFVYIDGNHLYPFVKRDIQMYYPKVKKGGVLGGHDFYYIWPRLIVAVISFCIREHKMLHQKYKDWWVVKS